MNLILKMYTEDLELFKELLKNFRHKEIKIDQLDEEEYNIAIMLSYEDKENLMLDISYFYSCYFMPPSKFKDIDFKSININVSNTIEVSMSDFLTDQKLKVIEDDIYVIDHMCSDIVNEQEELLTKIEAIYTFINQSGVLHYKNTISHLIDVMHQNGLVDKNEINKQIFPVTH